MTALIGKGVKSDAQVALEAMQERRDLERQLAIARDALEWIGYVTGGQDLRLFAKGALRRMDEPGKWA